MLADELDYVVGVDTHRDQHLLAVVVSAHGSCRRATAGARNRTRLLSGGEVRRGVHAGTTAVGDRGAGHYDAGLARHLSARDEIVHESVRSSRAERRLRGKDDPLDAVRHGALGHWVRHPCDSPFG